MFSLLFSAPSLAGMTQVVAAMTSGEEVDQEFTDKWRDVVYQSGDYWALGDLLNFLHIMIEGNANIPRLHLSQPLGE